MNEALYEYTVERFGAPERDLLRTMAAPAQAAGLPMIMVSEDQARFLRVLLKAVGAKRALDVGTLFGYSAAVMAKAMGPRGRVVSLELEPRHAQVAQRSLAALRLGGRVKVQVGAALPAMQKLRARSFDFALIDADKRGYVEYFDECLRLVRPGGLIAADNALAWGQVAGEATAQREPDVAAIRAFNDHVSTHPKVEASLLPIGDGLLVAHIKG